MYSLTESLITWLSALGYTAHTRPPKNAPAEFVTVERTGGYTENFVDHASIAIQTWAATEARADEMANAIRYAAIVGERPDGIAHMSVSGLYPFFDPSTGKPRYQLTLDVTAHI